MPTDTDIDTKKIRELVEKVNALYGTRNTSAAKREQYDFAMVRLLNHLHPARVLKLVEELERLRGVIKHLQVGNAALRRFDAALKTLKEPLEEPSP